ncbi:MAG: phosphate acyltransferase PlsX [Oscillospiraceae bacterium]|nr:phosphate acyltransferase PlsX [Oscillospiraceae bacterium]MBR3544846.1 phosphate acyltransferase PlsX [Oscillospiraceae bacterium]
MRILIDAMGGDNAPGEIVRGAVDARREFGTDITLFGQSDKVRPILAECGAASDEHITLVDAPDVITMEDDPATATRKKPNSSMTMALKALHLGEGDAMISAGSTGALLSGATLIVRRVRGIRRACFGPVLPNGKNGVLLIDSGANAECTPEYLLQFAYMGSFYSREILGCAEPRVGLLNIGAEESKGTPLQKETYELLRREDEAGRLRFIGNVEARDALFGGVDVLVTDGFSGNILLKGIEGTAVMLMKELKKIFYKNTKNKLAAAMLKNDVYALKALLDPSEVGGTALLGISKPVIKAHGSSDARAVRSAVKQAITFMNAGVIESIEKNIAYMRVGKED